MKIEFTSMRVLVRSLMAENEIRFENKFGRLADLDRNSLDAYIKETRDPGLSKFLRIIKAFDGKIILEFPDQLGDDDGI